jgi:hypothetical protein
MTFLDRFIFALAAAFAYAAYQNAKEAHRHTHELACHVGATELCDYHEAESHD